MHGQFYCRWHGLALGPGRRDWLTFPLRTTGCCSGCSRRRRARHPPPHRPSPWPPVAQSFATVIAVRGTCEPADVIANRLDPWHGTWYTPTPSATSPSTTPPRPTTASSSTSPSGSVARGGAGASRVRLPRRAHDRHDHRGRRGRRQRRRDACHPHRPRPLGRPITVMTEATIAHSDRRVRPRPGRRSPHPTGGGVDGAPALGRRHGRRAPLAAPRPRRDLRSLKGSIAGADRSTLDVSRPHRGDGGRRGLVCPRPARRDGPEVVTGQAPAREQLVGRHPAGRRRPLHECHRVLAAHAIPGQHDPGPASRRRDARPTGRCRQGTVAGEQPLLVQHRRPAQLG